MGNRTAKTTSLPLYLQLSEFLIREIAVGRLADGDKLPPERQMAVEYKTTVTTLRKALAILEQKKLLERIHGSGNYIRQKETVDSLYGMFRLELTEGGGLPTAETLGISVMTKPDDLPDFGTARTGTRVRRLRSLDATKIAVEEIWLDGNAGMIDPSRLQDSLYRYYRKNLGFWITRAEDRVGLGDSPRWSPASFGVPIGGPTGYIERLSWAQDPKPVEFSRTWFDTNKCNYVQRLK